MEVASDALVKSEDPQIPAEEENQIRWVTHTHVFFKMEKKHKLHH